MDKPKLEPCPCCGDPEPVYDEVEQYSWVMCCTCGLKAYSIDTEPEADPVTVWNRRPEKTK